MGYNLERLKKQYGLGSASKLGYAGASAPVGSIEGLEGEALRAFIEQQRRYDADMAAYNTYSDAYGNRLTNTPMYANPQFAQAKRDPRESMNLTGNYYDDILAGPIAEGNAEVVGGGGGGGGISGGITGGGNIGNGVNGGGDGEGQRQRDRAAGIGVYVPQLHPYDSEQAKLMREYNKKYDYPFLDQLSLDLNEVADNYKTSGGVFGAIGKGLSNIFNGAEVDPGPRINVHQTAQDNSGRFNTRPLSYRAPGFGALKSATASIPNFYNDAVALDRFPTSAYDGESALKERENALSFVPNNLGGYQLGMGSMGNNMGTPYDAQEFSGTGMAMGNDFAPAPIVPAPVLLDPASDAASFLARSQALSNKFNIPLEDLYDENKKILQQNTSNIQKVIPPAPQVNSGRNDPPYKASPYSGYSKPNKDEGGRPTQSSSPSRSSGNGTSRYFKAEGGHINGYAKGGSMGGPEDRYEIEKEIVLNAPVPDVSLEADVIDESLNLQGLIDQQTANATGAGSNASEMLKMLKQGEVNYADQISEQQGTYNTETQALKDMMIKMADSQSVGPSESEKWFRIAAAMGAPTKTGSFFENLGLTSEALGDISKERRAAQSAGDLVKMKAAEFSLGLLKDQLDSTKTMSAAQLTRNQNLQDRVMEWDQDAFRRSEENKFNLMTVQEERNYEQNQRKLIPQTAAGLAAEEAGYKKGTDEYKAFVKAVVERENKIAKLNIAALEREAQKLDSASAKEKIVVEKDIKNSGATILLLEEALELSKIAYAGDWYSIKEKQLMGILEPEDPRYKASERLENILSQAAVATLKSTFGGNISDGERLANLEVTGAKMRSVSGRNDTITLALETMRELDKTARAKLKKIMSDDYLKIETDEEGDN